MWCVIMKYDCFSPTKLTACSHSCSGSSVSSTSSTRSLKGLVYLRASPGLSFSVSLYPHLCVISSTSMASDTTRVPTTPTLQLSPDLFSRFILQMHSMFSFSLAFWQASQMYHVQNRILVSSCPQSTPPFFTILINSIPSIHSLKSET